MTEIDHQGIRDLLRESVINFCHKHYPTSADLELDAIICLTAKDHRYQDVVKIHQILPKSETKIQVSDQVADDVFRDLQPCARLGHNEEKSPGVQGDMENSDDKWIRMNRLKVYKKKRKIAMQRSCSSALSINPRSHLQNNDNLSNSSTGYMLRIPSLANQYSNGEGDIQESQGDNDQLDVPRKPHEKSVTSSEESFIKVEPTDAVEENFIYNSMSTTKDDSEAYTDSLSRECDISQIVFPPRQSDSQYSQLCAPFDLPTDSTVLANDDQTNGSDSLHREPVIFKKRKRKQSGQNILRVSEMKVESSNADGSRISSLLSGSENAPSVSLDSNKNDKVPKIIIRNAKNSLLTERHKKQPRLVSLLTSNLNDLPKYGLKGDISNKNENSKKEKIIAKEKRAATPTSVSDMADIASMQKAVSSSSVITLLKPKSNPLDESSAVDQTFYCSKCGGCFRSKKSRMRHEKYTCGELRSFECEICGKFYSRADSKTRHMFRIHGIKPGSQGQSDDSFLSEEIQNGSVDDAHPGSDGFQSFHLENDSDEGATIND